MVQHTCPLEYINPGEERVLMPVTCISFSVCITLDRDYRKQNLVVVEAEVQGLDLRELFSCILIH